MPVIVGINAYHGDSSACLVVDGALVCAIEEERTRRVKHWAGLPTEAIKWCLDYSGTDARDIDYFAIARDPSSHLARKILHSVTRTPSIRFLKNRLQNAAKISDLKAAICDSLGINRSLLRAAVKRIEHHRAHLASAYLVSPFEEAACVSVDGFGDFVSTMRGMGKGAAIHVLDWVEFPHSLGIFYTALTQYLGFWNYGDEYKIMGLSATGQPRYIEKMNEIIRIRKDGLFELNTSYFLHPTHGVEMVWNGGSPSIGRIFSNNLVALLGQPRDRDQDITDYHRDLAASVQSIYERVFFHILNDTHRRLRATTLTLAGGCIQNSLANGKITSETPFEAVYIPPASYDAGTAIGAAFWVHNVLLENQRGFIMKTPYWGPEYDDEHVERTCRNANVGYEKLDNEVLLGRVAADISQGKIVGWFQQRTEWGPRALGNRSILVDPRRKEMQDILNRRIKRRESFRPFAPAILENHMAEWFENSNPVPFMESVYRVRENARDRIPAVVHVDGTGRLQTVSQETNPKFYGLIEAFRRLTGVPILLNTSFNENEPIVNTPQEALNCFLRTRMDVLVIGSLYVSQDSSSKEAPTAALDERL
jgi:carbamoyltransferase